METVHVTNREREVDAMVQQRNVLRASDSYYRKHDGKGEFGTTYTK